MGQTVPGGMDRRKILSAGVAAYMCMGIFYSWSKFAGMIQAEFSFSPTRTTLVHTATMCMFTLGILLDGLLSSKLSSKQSIALGAALSACGFCGAALLPVRAGAVLPAVYGVPVGLGIGICYNAWLTTVVSWFPDKRGRATGLLLLGMGLSGVTTTPVMALLSEQLGWRISFGCIGAIQLVAGLSLRRFAVPAPSCIQKTVSSSAEISSLPSRPQYTSGQMVRKPYFWTFCIWKLLVIGLGQSLMGQLTFLLRDTGAGDGMQLAGVSLFVLCNGCARFVWGAISDRLGVLRTVISIAAVALVSQIALAGAIAAGNPGMALAALLMDALSYGGAAMMGANYIREMFGAQHYRHNNGVSALTALPGNLGATAVIGVVKQTTGSYLPFVLGAIGGVAVAECMAVLCVWFVHRAERSSCRTEDAKRYAK